MKSIVILFDDENSFENDKAFGGKTAVELTALWADQLKSKANIQKIVTLKKSDCVNLTALLETMKKTASEADADTIVYAFSDLPFINLKLTLEILQMHEEFKNEYTFADGYPYGFTPEVLDCGTCGILAELSKTTQAKKGELSVARDSIWELIKTDVNSFEVESLIAEEDYRMPRFQFDCTSKLNYLTSKNLYNLCEDKENLYSCDVEKLCSKAVKSLEILKTVPSFYNIQICNGINIESIYSPYALEYQKKSGNSAFKTDTFMPEEKFNKLIEQISDFSEKAVISFSAFGEALNHPQILNFVKKVLAYKGLSVFIETDGLKVSKEFCDSLKEIAESAEERTNGYQKVMVSITLDAFTSDTYKVIHNSDSFTQAVQAVTLLEVAIPFAVYPQFIRMNQNEGELENFYRYWNEKSNPSKGQLIIQKYDSFGGLLKDYKPADLAPIDRNVCWHLRRDITILTNGDVPLCKEFIYENVIGNVFADGIEKVWKKSDEELKNHINLKYCEKCRSCDEYYTFNF